MDALPDKTALDTFVNENKLALVDVFTIWCGPCRLLTKILEDLKRSDPNLAISKIDLDRNSAIATMYDIRAVPTLLLFKNGQLVDKKMGVQHGNTIRSWIQSHA